MILKRKKIKIDFIDTVIRRVSVLPLTGKKQGLDFLVSFFSTIRPSSNKGKRNAARNMESVIQQLHLHPVLLTNLQHALLSQLINTDLKASLTESGIPLAQGFWQEFFGRLRHKLLPTLQSEDDFLFVINHVFFRRNDYRWVESIPYETWVRFFEMIDLSFHADDRRIVRELLQSLKILAFRVAQLGLEKEVVNYIPAEEQEYNPFVELNYFIHELEDLFAKQTSKETIADISSKIDKVLLQCFQSIDHIRQNHSHRGASLHQTYTLIVLSNKLDRMTILIEVLDRNHHFDTAKFVDFFKVLVRNENRKNSVREFLSQCLGYLAYQIAEHKGSKGTKYITSTRAEYRAMLRSAMWGGAYVCVVVIIKNLITKMNILPFWHGFAYSVNYSAGFIAIEETHATLATKQPAYTASAVASSLDTRKNIHKPNLFNLAIIVAKVSRSQIASFAGNLLVVFPGAFVLAWLFDVLTGSKIVEGETAATLLKEQHPWLSLSLLYACNAGFFLFLSGIIAGYIQNMIQYSHIAKRLQTHPVLQFSFSSRQLNRFAQYIEKHAGSLIGNIALGFFLGMSGLIPKIFGIPFDVRHITISAGNAAVAVYGLGLKNINPWYLATVIGGVLGIGFLNFFVSFALAFLVAVKSRGVRIKEYPEFLGILWRYFRKSPLDFIRPRKRLAVEE